MSNEKIIAVKGFDRDLKCRGFQYEIGETYTHDGKVERCSSGFHSCDFPLDVFGYYPPGGSRYALVEIGGEMDREEGGDTKICSAEITIKAELKLPEVVQRGVDWILARIDKKAEANEDHSGVGNTGDRSAATNTGDRSAATVEGEDSVALVSGYEGRVSGAMGCALFLVERDNEMKIVAA